MDSHLRSRATPSPAFSLPKTSQHDPNCLPCKRVSSTTTFSLAPTHAPMTPQLLPLPPSGPLMTDQCTDQCVVITCNDPDHVDGISCDSLYGDFLTPDVATGPQRINPNAFLNYTTSCSRGPPDDLCSSKCSIQPVLEQGSGCGADCDAVYIDPGKCAECTPVLLDDFVRAH